MNMKVAENGAVHSVPFGTVDTDARVTACGRSGSTVYLTMAGVSCKSCLKIAAEVASELPRRSPAVPVIPIDDEVISSGVHDSWLPVTPYGSEQGALSELLLTDAQLAVIDGNANPIISTTATPKAWIRGCPSCKMPLVDNPAHLPGCEVALVQEVLTERGLPPVALNVEQLVTLISDVQREDAERVAEAPAWRCRDRVKATRVSRRRAQRGAMAR